MTVLLMSGPALRLPPVAGGQGSTTRFATLVRPITREMGKPMVPVVDARTSHPHTCDLYVPAAGGG